MTTSYTTTHLCIILVVCSILCKLAFVPVSAQPAVTDPNTSTKLKIQYLTKVEECHKKSVIGDTLQVYYIARINETVIDSRLGHQDPLEITLGSRHVIKGVDRGLRDMCVGERRRLIIPPLLAYGIAGIPGQVPPNSTIIFDIELVAFGHYIPPPKPNSVNDDNDNDHDSDQDSDTNSDDNNDQNSDETEDDADTNGADQPKKVRFESPIEFTPETNEEEDEASRMREKKELLRQLHEILNKYRDDPSYDFNADEAAASFKTLDADSFPSQEAADAAINDVFHAAASAANNRFDPVIVEQEAADKKAREESKKEHEKAKQFGRRFEKQAQETSTNNDSPNNTVPSSSDVDSSTVTVHDEL